MAETTKYAVYSFFGALGIAAIAAACSANDPQDIPVRNPPKDPRLARLPEAGAAAWHDYLNLRENPAGPNAELWQHAWGCRAWLRVVRDTRDDAVLEVGLARERPR